MAKTPTPEDIALPGIQGPRPVAGYDVSALAQGGQALARGEQQLGAGVEHGASQVAEAEMYQARNSTLLAQDNALGEAITYRDEAKHNPNLTPEQYGAGLDAIGEKHLNTIPEGPLRDHARARMMVPFAREKASFNEQYIAGQNNEEKARLQNEADELANSTGPADDPLHTAKVEQFGVKLQDATGRGVFKPTEARVLGQRLAIGIREGESKSRFRMGPDAAAAEVARLEAIQSRGTGMALNSFPPATGATISNVASRYGVDPATLGRAVQIESSGNPNAHTGSYKGILQLSDSEFEKYKPRPDASIWNMEDNLAAGAAKMRAEGDVFAHSFGRQPSGFDSYMIHQQGLAGYSAHLANPNAPAWQNMLSTAEGRQKGEAWAKAAIWGNTPDQYKTGFGNVNNVSSGNFLGMWQQKWGGAGHPPQGNADATSLPRGPQGGGTQTAQNIDDILPPAKLDALIREGHTQLNAYRVDDDRAQREHEKAIKAASDQEQLKIFGAIHTGSEPVTARQILDNPVLTPEHKEKLVNLLEKKTAEDGKDHDVKTYGKGFYEAYQAVHAKDDDPKRITDPTQLYAHLGSDLTMAGIDKLTSEIQGRKTPEGVAEKEMMGQFLKNAKGQITGTDEGLHLRDPKGDELHLKFLAQVLPAYDAARKEGKTPAQLLNPDSPDYIGKSIAGFKRPMDQWYADAVQDAPATSAKPGAAPKFDIKSIKDVQGAVAAYKTGQITKAQADEIALERGWAVRKPPAPAVPVIPMSQ